MLRGAHRRVDGLAILFWSIFCILRSTHVTAEFSPEIDYGAIQDALRAEVGPRLGDPRPSKILLFPPICFESHLFVFKTLGRGLKQFGHNLTLYVGDRRHIEEDSPDFSVQRFPGIFSTQESDDFIQSKVSNILRGKPTFLELFDILAHYSHNCDVIFSEGRESLEQLRKANYDLVIVDPNEMCGFLVAKELDIPSIAFSTGMWVPYEAYVPTPLAYVPEFNSQLTDRMNFPQRVWNLLMYGVSRFGTSFLIFPIYNRLATKHQIGVREAGDIPATMDALIKDTKAWILCTDLALEFPRPTLPNVEYVGGIMGSPANPLPEDLALWAEESKKTGGFIVVSFGAGVKKLNKRLETIYTNVLSQLPYKVLWRYPVTPEGAADNIRTMHWLPQNDLLGHPNILAFIGHGGTNGVYECLYHGVPILGMPLFGDHYDSMMRVHGKGMGIFLSWRTLTEETLMDAVKKLLTDPSYRYTIQKYSRIHHDQPIPPLERAVRRIDYTIRYEGADHFRPVAYDIPWWKYFLLDVQLAFVGLYLAVAWLVQRFVMAKPAEVRESGRTGLLKEMDSPTNVYLSPTTASKVVATGHVHAEQRGCKEPIAGCLRTAFGGASLCLLYLCDRLRILAVCLGGHFARLRGSSRCCLRCLGKFSGVVRSASDPAYCKAPNGGESKTHSSGFLYDNQTGEDDPEIGLTERKMSSPSAVSFMGEASSPERRSGASDTPRVY